MNDLGPEARSLLAAARDADSLTREDRARLKRSVLLRVAVLGAASTATSGAVAMSVATKVTLTVLTVAALGGGSVSLWAWKGRRAEPPVTARTHATPRKLAVAAPKSAAASDDSRALVPEPEVKVETQPVIQRRDVIRGVSRPPEILGAPPAEIAPAPASASVLAPAPAIDPLNPELTVLRLAQEDLRAGRPAQALRRLTEYDHRFGKGVLAEERRALAAIAFCQVNPGPEANTRAARFLQTAPESPLVERVRSACQRSSEIEK